MCFSVILWKHFLPFVVLTAHGQSDHGEKNDAKFARCLALFVTDVLLLYGHSIVQHIAILLTLLGLAIYKFFCALGAHTCLHGLLLMEDAADARCNLGTRVLL
jgi:hypothetical protein